MCLLLGQQEAPEPQITKLPKLLHYVEAVYPPQALASGEEGAVVMWLDIGASGEVENVEIAESAGEAFDEAASAAAKQFLFSPAEIDGKPAPVRIKYRYGFVLKIKSTSTSSTTQTATQAATPEKTQTATAAPPGPVNFLGTLKEAGSRAPVHLAEVRVESAQTSTSVRSDREGRFAFRGLAPGLYTVTVAADFFEALKVPEKVERGEALEVLYYLQRNERDPYEVVVRAARARKEVARRTLTFEEVERLPGTQGDAIRVIQNLPGVARAPYGLGVLVVRGAPPQDTGVFLDGHPLPILFHFGGLGGFNSVVNARMLESIDFFPGGFGPQFGRRSAGSVQLKSRFARTDRVHGEAVIDIAGANVYVEGPVTDDPDDGAFVIGLRRSYIDGVAAGVISATEASFSIAPRYYDYQVRYDKPLWNKDWKLTLLGYGSDDELILLGTGGAGGGGAPDGTQSKTYFHRINPQLSYIPDSKTRLTISPIVGFDFSNTETTGDPSGNRLRFLLKSWNVGMRIDGEKQMTPWFKLSTGGDLRLTNFETDSELPSLPSTRGFPGPLPTDTPTRVDRAVVPAIFASFYTELEIKPSKKLTLWPGVRFDLYSFKASGETVIDPRLLNGRMLFSVDPRLTARWNLAESFSLSAQAGLYHQPPFPTQIYVNADLPLQRAQQYSGGFEWQIWDKLSLDIQGFYRFQDRVPRLTGQTEIVDGVVRIVGFLPEGQRRSYGAEMLLKLRKWNGLHGWIAYTLSRSEARRVGGEWEPNFFFDQTHNFNIVAAYELGLSWFVSARWRYVTGGGITGTEARWYDSDRDSYNRRSTTGLVRAPAFHQLDLRVDKRFTFDEWYLELYLDVQNVYNRTNTEFFISTFDFKEEIAVPGLPVLPVLGIKGVF